MMQECRKLHKNRWRICTKYKMMKMMKVNEDNGAVNEVWARGEMESAGRELLTKDKDDDDENEGAVNEDKSAVYESGGTMIGDKSAGIGDEGAMKAQRSETRMQWTEEFPMKNNGWRRLENDEWR